MLGTLACTSQSIVDEDKVMLPMSLRQFQRAGEGAVGFGGELRFVMAHEVDKYDYSDHRDNAENDPSASTGKEPPGLCQVRELAAKRESRSTEKDRPDKRAHEAGKQIVPPRHAIGSGKDAGDRADARKELGTDTDNRPMFQEQVLAELDAWFGDPNVGAVTQEQPITEFCADQVAEYAPKK